MTSTENRVAYAEDGLAIEAEIYTATGAASALWMSETSAIVCPRSLTRRAGFAEAARQSKDRGWPVYLRRSGGGAVPEGPGVLNVALGMTQARGFTIEAGYRMLSDVIRAALGQDGDRLESGDTTGSFCDGAWNLMVGGRKVAGLAQQLRPLPDEKLRILAHAMILVDGDVVEGAGAVDRLHKDLGLPTIRADTHTTLEKSLNRTDGWTDFAGDLLAAAQEALATHARSGICRSA
ncbi:MAG: hypothetical protein AAGD43_00270 [Pseudomonadota bacterium]